MSAGNGGCAFPWVDHYVNVETGERYENYGNAGMTLRDYLAAKAMQGMLANGIPSGEIPLYAYEIADAMIQVRGQ